uniref:Uncharacterized protein n=1 Tax=viral metagenome TaxID=1070528 RepID=A0A6M3JWF4_9ZZZZ
MIVCDDGHVDICYDYRDCPLCKCIAEKECLEYDIRELKDIIDGLERELNNLTG